MRVRQHDVLIVGGGIVGLATALAARRRWPDARLALLEKEPRVGLHQTSHNSGVLHAGIYYRPGSLKASLCLRGMHAMKAYCAARGVPTLECGKLIVATREEELPKLEELHTRSLANGVPVERVAGDDIPRFEPSARGLAALHSPSTGIVDYGEVARHMREELLTKGVEVRTGERVRSLRETKDEVEVRTEREQLRAERVIACAGLHSDQVARSMGLEPEVRILPFRGEYYFLRPALSSMLKGLVYPVPDPSLPFLGVHLTRTIDGRIEAGPNAVLAWAREGYTHGTVQGEDLAETLSWPGLWKVASRYWKTALYEMRRSFSRELFARDLARLIPGLRAADLAPGGAGVRAQAVRRDGSLVDDFHFAQTERTLHVLNAPSPAATASLAIGEHIVERLSL